MSLATISDCAYPHAPARCEQGAAAPRPCTCNTGNGAHGRPAKADLP